MLIALNTKLFDKDVEMKATRDGYGKGLMELGESNKDVVVLTGDLRESVGVKEFSQKYPDRFVECGVAEQNMVGIAAGMAAAGKIPYVSSYAVFSPGRTWDQIRVSVCYSNLNVKIVGGHTGLGVGPDGATHQALEDIAIMRVLPNMAVIVPCDSVEAKKATVAIANSNGPAYLRLTREKTPIVTIEDSDFKIGKAEILWDSEAIGNRQKAIVAIVGCGPLVYQSLIAAKELHEEGIGTVVINNHTIKPMDKECILRQAQDCGAVVTVEDHQIAGGMGSAVAEVLVSGLPAGRQVPLEFVGMNDSFGESGQAGELFEKFGMSVVNIKAAVKKVVSRKSQNTDR